MYNLEELKEICKRGIGDRTKIELRGSQLKYFISEIERLRKVLEEKRIDDVDTAISKMVKEE